MFPRMRAPGYQGVLSELSHNTTTDSDSDSDAPSMHGGDNRVNDNEAEKRTPLPDQIGSMGGTLARKTPAGATVGTTD